jgi:hypothetical protein
MAPPGFFLNIQSAGAFPASTDVEFPFMKRLALFLLPALSVTAAIAQSGSTTSMTCQQARAVVNSNGAVVLHTGPTTYDRFVRDPSFCPWPMTARRAYAPTRDTPQCPVGATCTETTNENGQ